jgi:peptide/nickel transport system substrate-binding protein
MPTPTRPRAGESSSARPAAFDSLNPYILRGRAPWGVGLLTVETLLGRSYDEPFTLYGLLAESVETNDGRDFVEFTLREEARFSDGTPVTVEDVMWSFETLGTDGSPATTAPGTRSPPWSRPGRARSASPSPKRTANCR